MLVVVFLFPIFCLFDLCPSLLVSAWTGLLLKRPPHSFTPHQFVVNCPAFTSASCSAQSRPALRLNPQLSSVMCPCSSSSLLIEILNLPQASVFALWVRISAFTNVPTSVVKPYKCSRRESGQSRQQFQIGSISSNYH